MESVRIRRFIDKDACHSAVRTLVTSRLDYGNAHLLASHHKIFPGCSISRTRLLKSSLQLGVVNMLAQSRKTFISSLSTKGSSFSCLSTSTSVYTIDQGPGYLTDHLHISSPRRRTGLELSSNTTLLTIPKSSKLKNWKYRARRHQKITCMIRLVQYRLCRIMYNVCIVLYIVFAVKIIVNMIYIHIIWFYHYLYTSIVN